MFHLLLGNFTLLCAVKFISPRLLFFCFFPLENSSKKIKQMDSCSLTTWFFLTADEGRYTACTCGCSYLHPGLGELGPLRQLLPGVDVWVVGPLEGPLQLLQLLSCEGGPTAPLFPLQRQIRLRLHIRALVRVARCSVGDKQRGRRGRNCQKQCRFYITNPVFCPIWNSNEVQNHQNSQSKLVLFCLRKLLEHVYTTCYAHLCTGLLCSHVAKQTSIQMEYSDPEDK